MLLRAGLAAGRGEKAAGGAGGTSGDGAAWSAADALRWRSLAASAAEVADARQQAALSFGSCSFDEPRDDLRDLGWL